MNNVRANELKIAVKVVKPEIKSCYDSCYDNRIQVNDAIAMNY
jgi:hypothetical protein